MKVLFVDDNQDLADILAELAFQMGHEARAAYNGSAGLQAAREEQPDVVFLDLGLPDMTGIEVLRALRNAEGTDRALIYALTGTQ
ncbi:response regulator [Pararobbsia alpina]|uniref:response regulator n=1 Tax=Pararobbsia alpina TaxID=621374 RepID=UPI001583E85B|nr:response regulator [Pararobbsia alpina]